jgi:hypothetical protein
VGARATHISSDQLTLFKPGRADYANHITTCHPSPGFSDLPTALEQNKGLQMLYFLMAADDIKPKHYIKQLNILMLLNKYLNIFRFK